MFGGDWFEVVVGGRFQWSPHTTTVTDRQECYSAGRILLLRLTDTGISVVAVISDRKVWVVSWLLSTLHKMAGLRRQLATSVWKIRMAPRPTFLACLCWYFVYYWKYIFFMISKTELKTESVHLAFNLAFHKSLISEDSWLGFCFSLFLVVYILCRSLSLLQNKKR